MSNETNTFQRLMLGRIREAKDAWLAKGAQRTVADDCHYAAVASVHIDELLGIIEGLTRPEPPAATEEVAPWSPLGEALEISLGRAGATGYVGRHRRG